MFVLRRHWSPYAELQNNGSMWLNTTTFPIAPLKANMKISCGAFFFFLKGCPRSPIMHFRVKLNDSSGSLVWGVRRGMKCIHLVWPSYKQIWGVLVIKQKLLLKYYCGKNLQLGIFYRRGSNDSEEDSLWVFSYVVYNHQRLSWSMKRSIIALYNGGQSMVVVAKNPSEYLLAFHLLEMLCRK